MPKAAHRDSRAVSPACSGSQNSDLTFVMMSQDEAHTAALKKKLIDDTKSCFQGEKLVKFHTQNARIFHKKKLFFSVVNEKSTQKLGVCGDITFS